MKERKEALSFFIKGRPFSNFALDPRLKDFLLKKGFMHATILQDLFLPLFLKGKDILIKSFSHKGKSLGYTIGVIQRLLELSKESPVRALVLGYRFSRLEKLSHRAQKLCLPLGLKATPFIGKEDIPRSQLKALEQGAHLIFSHPIWFLRVLNWKLFPVTQIKIVIFDEFDLLVSKQRINLEKLIKKLPPPSSRQTSVFIQKANIETLELAYSQLCSPEELFIEEARKDFSHITLKIIHVAEEEKFSCLLEILRKVSFPKILICVKSASVAQKLKEDLERNGFKSIFLKPDLGPSYRLHFLKQFIKKEVPILIITDAALIYLEDPEISFLINYDLPETGEEFRLRSNKISPLGGTILSLCDETGAFFLENIEKDLGQKMEKIDINFKDSRLLFEKSLIKNR